VNTPNRIKSSNLFNVVDVALVNGSGTHRPRRNQCRDRPNSESEVASMISSAGSPHRTGGEYSDLVNPLQRVARNPTAYRWLVLKGRPMAVALESLLRFASTGRLGVLDLTGLPNVQVTTSGRKTGLARTATVQYVPAGDGLIVVGSNWGRERHPSWSANLKATERVTVRERGHRFTAKVRLLTGEERDKAWAAVVAQWPNYQIAQDCAGSRRFRLFLLTPTDDARITASTH
jgi:deazaflavin-dependent oxidoreductase (nitroreductase family)